MAVQGRTTPSHHLCVLNSRAGVLHRQVTTKACPQRWLVPRSCLTPCTPLCLPEPCGSSSLGSCV